MEHDVFLFDRLRQAAVGGCVLTHWIEALLTHFGLLVLLLVILTIVFKVSLIGKSRLLKGLDRSLSANFGHLARGDCVWSLHVLEVVERWADLPDAHRHVIEWHFHVD